MNDQKMRKLWFALLLLSPVISFASFFLQSQFDPNWNAFPGIVKFISMGSSSIGVGIFTYILYRCAYKKPGTKMLFFCLVVTTLSWLSTPWFYVTGRMDHFFTYIPYYWVQVVIGQGISIFWFFLCWKMRLINQRLKKI
jgi:hypothetical protein